MARFDEIGWGGYRSFEGPFWPGRGTPFVLPENPTKDDKILAVISATEGGSYSAINMLTGPYHHECSVRRSRSEYCEAHSTCLRTSGRYCGRPLESSANALSERSIGLPSSGFALIFRASASHPSSKMRFDLGQSSGAVGP